MDRRLEDVPPEIIDTSWALLRPVQEDTEEFVQLQESIAQRGVLQSVLVREISDKDGVTLSLIDGLQRTTAAVRAKTPLIPAHIYSNCSDEEALALQIEANLHRCTTRLAEYGQGLRRILQLNEKNELTVVGLAKRINASVKFVEERLSLTNLLPEIQQAVNEKAIKAMNAIELAKLNHPDQRKFIHQAQTLPVKDFASIVRQRISDMRTKNIRAKYDPKEVPIGPHARPPKEIEKEITYGQIAKTVARKVSTKEEAFTEGLKYCLRIDDKTVAERRAKLVEAWKETEKRRAESKNVRGDAKIADLQAKIESLREEQQERNTELKGER